MSDLISRQYLLDLATQEGAYDYVSAYEIANAPAVDAVEVVRCNNCVLHDNCITEDVFKLAGKADGFCCVGKKAY